MSILTLFKGRALVLFFLLGVPIYVSGSNYEAIKKTSYDECFNTASSDSGIDKNLLVAIAKVESNLNHLAIGSNHPAKGFGIGMMQIDSQHLSYFERNFGILAEDLLINECVNIYAGTYILKNIMINNGGNWDSVGAYNAGLKKSSKQERRRYLYAQKVRREYKEIIAKQ